MDADGVALVTGASRGIGRALAIELAVRGFDVVATMRRPADGAGLADEVGAARGKGRLRVERLDVTDAEGFVAPAGLRVLVNNAAVDATHKPVEHTSLGEWQAMFATNVFGAVAVTRAAIPALRASGGGVVCSVSSLATLVPMPFYAVYRASKAALGALDESLRAELAPFGIRVLEVLPGPVATDMFATAGEEPGGPGYEGLAGWARSGREAFAGSAATPAAAVAVVADAILDDSSPLRIGCDPVSTAMLAAWRTQADEPWMRSLLPSPLP